MSWHHSKIIFLYSLLLIFFGGCTSSLNMSSTKSFEDEDKLILSSIYDTQNGNHKKASKAFDTLFKESNKPEYLISKIKIDSIYLKKYNTSIEILDEYISSYPKNKDFLKTAFDVSILDEKYKVAIEYAKKLLELEKSQSTYLNIANGYILSKDFKQAIPYLERAYGFEHNELLLGKMVTLMYLYENHKEKALSYLETHVRLYYFGEKTAQRLLAIYKENNNIQGLISVYKRLNIRYPKKEYSNILMQLYVLQDKKKELVDFLMKNTIDVDTFVSIYRYIDNKSDGYKIAMGLYKKSNNINFLAQAAMLEYELSLVPKSKYSIDDAILKLTEVVKVEANPDYLNYLGYILIKHDGNLTEGMGYIKEALKTDPESPYYLDSLAWGYYKLRKYEKAYSIMKKVVLKLGKDDKEVSFHLLSIEKKLKIKEKSNKRKERKKSNKIKINDIR